jgi:hypothetical protein
LVLGGEYTIGEGDGDQFTGWTGGQKSPINQGAAGSAPTVNLDGGIGGFLPNNDFGLMKVQTWNVYLQYHLPENWRMWVSAGYGHLNSANVSNFIGTLSNLSALGAYYQDEVYFTNVSHDFTDHIRAGLEYANLTTSYVDGTKASDNRVQLSGWFIF